MHKHFARKERRLNDRRSVEEGYAADNCGSIPPGARVEGSWRTPTVLAIARRIQARSEVAALPVLADALEEAGCSAADLLSHLRDVGGHRDGCWVVELVLR